MQEPFAPTYGDGQAPLVYRLEGVDLNPVSFDTREAFERSVAKLVADGMDPERAEVRAYEQRGRHCGIGPEHGFFGEPVAYGFHANTEVLVAPLSDDQIDAIAGRCMMHPLELLDKIVYVLLLRSVVSRGDKDVAEVEIAPEGGIATPGEGALYGTPEENADELVASLLCAHGRVEGVRADGGYILGPITFEEVKECISEGFAFEVLGNGMTVLEEVLRATGLWEIWNGGVLVFHGELPEEEVTTTFRELIASGPVTV